MIQSVYQVLGWFILKNAGLGVGSFFSGAEIYLPLIQIDPRYPGNRRNLDPVRTYAPPSVFIEGSESPTVVLQTLVPYGVGSIGVYDVLTALTQPFDFRSGYQYALKIADGSNDYQYSIRYLNYCQCVRLELEQYAGTGGLILTLYFAGTDGRVEGASDDAFTSGIVFSTTGGGTILGPYLDMATFDFGSDPTAPDGVEGYRVTFMRRSSLQFGYPDWNFPNRPPYIASGVSVGPLSPQNSRLDLMQLPTYNFTAGNVVVIRAFGTMNQYVWVNADQPIYPMRPVFGTLQGAFNLLDVENELAVYPLQFGPYA